MLEVEVKAPAGEGRDAEAVVARVEALGGTPTGTFRQVDAYHRHPVRDFAVTDEALRIRTITTPDGARTREVTYKGPKLDATTKTRVELTVALGEGPATDLLAALGFPVVAGVSKTRRTFATDGIDGFAGFEVCVDEVDGLGMFVEVEAAAAEGTDHRELGARALALLAAIGCGAPERRSYLELLLAAGDQASSFPKP